jgi:hypothetical protein
MGQLKMFFLGVIFCILFVACTTVAFPYKYYAYDKNHEVLLGAKPSDDLPSSICLPNPQSNLPCTVLDTSVFLKLKADYEKLQLDLDKCQRGSTP